MEQTFEASKWFDMALQSSWLFALMPLGLSFLILVLLWQRWSAAAAVHRAISLASQATGIPLYRRAHLQLAEELARARRYQHPLTVLVVSLASDEPVALARHGLTAGGNGSSASSMQHMLFFQLTFSLVGSPVRQALRESDILTYDAANHQYVILLTESTTSQALQAARRLQTLLYQQTHIQVRVRVAEFPTDGLTMEELVNSARASDDLPALDNAASEPTGEQSV